MADRIGRVAENLGGVRLHLLHQLDVTSEIASKVPQLPVPEEWVIVLENTNSDTWTLQQRFDSFEAADEAFVRRCRNRGFSGAERLGMGKG